jgi:hypothetical protein
MVAIILLVHQKWDFYPFLVLFRPRVRRQRDLSCQVRSEDGMVSSSETLIRSVASTIHSETAIDLSLASEIIRQQISSNISLRS